MNLYRKLYKHYILFLQSCSISRLLGASYIPKILQLTDCRIAVLKWQTTENDLNRATYTTATARALPAVVRHDSSTSAYVHSADKTSYKPLHGRFGHDFIGSTL